MEKRRIKFPNVWALIVVLSALGSMQDIEETRDRTEQMVVKKSVYSNEKVKLKDNLKMLSSMLNNIMGS